MKKCLTIVATMWLLCSSAWSQSYDLLTRGQSGDVSAQMILGDMFAAGEGVAQDYVEAAWWYRSAAKRGAANAQLSLGLLYSQGKGVEQNLELAFQWVSVAAAQGVEAAIKTRDSISEQLDPETRDRAQQLATRCLESKFTQCEG
jgi:TPR repeat protein